MIFLRNFTKKIVHKHYKLFNIELLDSLKKLFIKIFDAKCRISIAIIKV